MKIKTPPQKPDKWNRPYRIKATIRGIKRNWLTISYHYKKRNREYLKGCKRRGEEPDRNRIFNNQVIRDMVQQLHEKELDNQNTMPIRKQLTKEIIEFTK